MRKFTLLIASLFITIGAMAQTATTYADGVYKIFWQYDQRGYLTYHADYPNDPQLAGVVNHNPNGHYQLTDEGIQLSWYLYTSATTSKSYLFEATTGKFITIDMNTTSGNGKRCALSEVVSEFAQFDLKATTNTTAYMLSYGSYNFCSGCGTNKGAGPVRFATDGQTDGGIPFVFVTDGASITDEVKNAAIAKIEAFETDNTVAVAELDEAIDKAIAMSAFIGEGVGKYSYTGDGDYQDIFAEIVAFRQGITASNTPTPEEVAAKTAELNALLSSFVLNMPKNGEYFRVAYDYGGTIGKLYLQGIDSEQIKNNQVSPPAKFSSETGAESIWYYYDGVLYSYTAGKCLREDGNNRGLQSIGTKTTATFSASTRVEGKYNIACASYIHANSTGENYYTDHCTANNCAAHDLILEAITELPVTVTAAGYATLYAPVALTVPTGVTAHTVILNGEWATLSEALTTIPANTGVVLVGEGSHSFAITTADAFDGTNALLGSAPATYYTEAGTYYALAQVEGEVGFYKDEFNNSRFQNNSHKAYLYVAEAAAGTASYSFRFGEGTTGIDEITDNREQSTVIYDLTGRRVEAITAPGIYIVGGKKVLVR